MEPTYAKIRYVRAANDDAEADIVPAHLAARRVERRIMAGAAILAVAMLATGMVQNSSALRDLPDAVNSAFRV